MLEVAFKDKPSKADAERLVTMLAKALNLDIKYKRVHGLSLYKKCYTLDRKMQPTITDTLQVLQDFIILSRYAKNDLELPSEKDKAGIFATEPKQGKNEITFR